MIPSWRQFKNWSLPSKYTFVAFWLALFLFFIQYYISNLSNTNNIKEVVISSTINFDKKIIDRLQQQNLDILNKLTESLSLKERKELELQSKVLQNKLTNLEKTLADERKLRNESLELIKKLKIEVPSIQLDIAEDELKKGNKEEAEKAFDEIEKNESKFAALASFQSGKLAESRADYKKAMQRYKRAVFLENTNEEYLTTAAKLARILGNFDQASLWLKESISIKLKSLKRGFKKAGLEYKDVLDLSDSQREVIQTYVAEGKLEPAVKYYEEALKRQVFDIPLYVEIKSNLASIYMQQGKYNLALPLLQQVLIKSEKLNGKNSPAVASTLFKLSRVDINQKNYDQANKKLLRSLKIIESKFKGKYDLIPLILYRLGRSYAEEGKLENAISMFSRSINHIDKLYGKGHYSTAIILMSSAKVYQKKCEHIKALKQAKQSLVVIGTVYSKGDPTFDTIELSFKNVAKKWARYLLNGEKCSIKNNA